MILTKYSHFDTPMCGRAASVAKHDIKANSAELKLELGLSLATAGNLQNMLFNN
jgi:hypothetical protein